MKVEKIIKCTNCGTGYLRKRGERDQLCSMECRFYSKINYKGPIIYEDLGNCHIWIGATYRDGRGQIRFGNKNHIASRVAWYIEKGYWSEKWILHTCDNGLGGCVRVDHMYEGTREDNENDKIIRNRTARGATLPRTVLTEDNVRDIRKSINEGKSNIEICKLFNVERGTIANIRSNKNWKWLK